MTSRAAALGMVAAGAAGLVAGYTAGFGPRSQVFGDFPWCADPGPADDPRIALTFDDGPNEPYTSRLLDLLAEHHATATFFQVGRCGQCGSH